MNSWIRIPYPNPQARLRLFCFPYAGGGALGFLTWPRYLPSETEVCAIQLPGREERIRETPISRLSLVMEPLTEMMETYTDKPFAFFGHSLGSMISFELARELRRRNAAEPLHLFVSGRRAPHIPNPDPPIHQLPDADFIEKLRKYNGTPEAVLQHAELMELLLPVLKADFGIHETYVYASEAPLDCPISAFGGSEDAEAPQDKLAAWEAQTNGQFSLRMFPGGHFFLQEYRDDFLHELSRYLQRLI
ncbi:thioesterase domain-containing protein [Desulfococcaceae bacterium HSG8]|nr:thioesterase domain-containing protein [Desulfococcaceae bacterium HSG8]